MRNGYDYVESDTIRGICKFLGQYRKSAFLLAGGTDLLVNIKEGKIRPQVIIGLSRLEKLKKIILLDNGGVRVGALVTMSQIASHPMIKKNYQALSEAALTVGSSQIRNRATLVGNICNASPAADTAPALMIFEALVNIVNINCRRIVPILEFFKGPGKTVLKKGEMVESIDIPRILQSSSSCYLKLGRTKGVDLAIIGVAALMFSTGQVKLSLSSVAPTPIRLKKTEKMFSKKAFLDPTNVKEALKIMNSEICPISDIRASDYYRRAMAAVFIKRALRVSNNRLKERE